MMGKTGAVSCIADAEPVTKIRTGLRDRRRH